MQRNTKPHDIDERCRKLDDQVGSHEEYPKDHVLSAPSLHGLDTTSTDHVGHADLRLQGSLGLYLSIHYMGAFRLVGRAYLCARETCRLSSFSRFSVIGTDAL